MNWGSWLLWGFVAIIVLTTVSAVAQRTQLEVAHSAGICRISLRRSNYPSGNLCLLHSHFQLRRNISLSDNIAVHPQPAWRRQATDVHARSSRSGSVVERTRITFRAPHRIQIEERLPE